jgi:DNA-binding transcriptional LysR family regulator
VELQALRYLLTVARTGSVSAAARELHLSQPSLSRQLQQLERQIGLTLFARKANSVHLSSAGRDFVGIAEDLVTRANAALSAAARLASGRLTHLTIAAPATTSTEVVAPFLARLRPDDPFVSIRSAAPDHVFDQLRTGADLALATELPPSGYLRHRIAIFPIWLYVRDDHEWARRASVDLAELLDQPVLLLPTSYKPRRVLDHALEQRELVLNFAVETSSPETAQALAAAGRGFAVVSDETRFGLRGIRITSNRSELTINLYAAWDPHHHAATVLADFAKRISMFCEENYGSPETWK